MKLLELCWNTAAATDFLGVFILYTCTKRFYIPNIVQRSEDLKEIQSSAAKPSTLILYYLRYINNIHHGPLIPISMQIKQHCTHSDPNSITTSSNIFLQSQRCTALLNNKCTHSKSLCLPALLAFCCSPAVGMVWLGITRF